MLSPSDTSEVKVACRAFEQRKLFRALIYNRECLIAAVFARHEIARVFHELIVLEGKEDDSFFAHRLFLHSV